MREQQQQTRAKTTYERRKFRCLGFRFEGSGFWVLGLRVKGLGFRVWDESGFGFWMKIFGMKSAKFIPIWMKLCLTHMILPRGCVSPDSWASLVGQTRTMIGPVCHSSWGVPGMIHNRHPEVAATMVRCLSGPTDMRHFTVVVSCPAELWALGCNIPEWPRWLLAIPEEGLHFFGSGAFYLSSSSGHAPVARRSSLWPPVHIPHPSQDLVHSEGVARSRLPVLVAPMGSILSCAAARAFACSLLGLWQFGRRQRRSCCVGRAPRLLQGSHR